MNVYVDTVESPAGELAFAVDGEGALVALHFVEGDGYVEMEEAMEDEGFVPLRDEGRTAGAREEVREYYAGERREFGLPLTLVGSEWQKAVWLELTRIPYGETRSYGEIADRLDRPTAARAVGRANATNRLRRAPCPGYIHDIEWIEGRLAAAGFRRRSTKTAGFWYLAVFERSERQGA